MQHSDLDRSARRRARAAAAAAVFAALVLAVRAVERSPRRPASPAADELRDAPNAEAPVELARRHLGPSADPDSSCILCHLAKQIAVYGELWRAAGQDAPAGPPDLRAPSSQVCLSCHDGTSKGDYMRAYSAIKGNHPVGMDYRAIAAASPQAYWPAGPGSRIRLEGGKVGCLSCHHLHDPQPARSGVPPNVCGDCHRQ